MIRKLIIITSVLTGLGTSCALAEGLGSVPAQISDSRIRVVPYDENDIYTISAKVGYQTSVIFGEDEEVQTISVGDRSPWQIIPSGSRLFIRPMVEGVTTNMTLITNKHTYQFDLKSAPPEGGSIVYVLKFTYNDPTKASAMLPLAPVLPIPTGAMPSPFTPPPYAPSPSRPSAPKPPVHYGPTSPQNPNYNYTYSGPDDLAPLQVYDDGTSTYVTYRNINQPLPNVYVIDESGDEKFVPARVVEDKMVIDAVAGKLALKNSNGTVHIYNETINPR